MKQTGLVILALGLTSQQAVAHAVDPNHSARAAQTVVASVEARPAVATEAPLSDTELLASALRDRVSIAHERFGYGIPTAHCRKASEGCDRRMQLFAEYLVDAGHARGIDPWLLAAMAVRESTLDPFAVGGVGELGILQIHPKRPDAKQVRFMRDASYRKRCRAEEGACQREIVEHAAHILEQSLTTCRGRLSSALGAYNSGRCSKSKDYARRVLQERASLKATGRKVALRARTQQAVASKPATQLQAAVARNEAQTPRTSSVSVSVQ